MPYSTRVIRLLDRLEPPTREVLLAVLEELERQREESVTKREFNELKEIVRELSENQKLLQEEIRELARKQSELAEEHKQLQKELRELAENQKKLQEELRKLVGEHRKTREQLGGLAHSMGYLLEDRAYKGLPALLERDFGLRVVTPLRRRYLEVSPGRYLEVNILGEAARNGEKVFVVGECKTQLRKKDVDAFLKQLPRLEKLLGRKVFPVLVAYQTPPQVEEYLEEKGLKLYFSYELPL